MLGFFIFICFNLSLVTFARDLPSYFPRCSINDVHLDECLLNATRTLKPRIMQGVKEIKLPPLDPLVMAFSASQDSSLLNFNASLVNFTIYGFDSYEFDELRYDPKSLELNGKVRIKNIHTSFTYKLNGRIIYFPANGEGGGEVDFGHINVTFNAKGSLVKHKDVEYYRPTSSKIQVKILGATAYLKGLFADNSELGHLTNELININSQQIADGVTPVFERIIDMLFMRFLSNLTKLVPYYKIFPLS